MVIKCQNLSFVGCVSGRQWPPHKVVFLRQAMSKKSVANTVSRLDLTVAHLMSSSMKRVKSIHFRIVWSQFLAITRVGKESCTHRHKRHKIYNESNAQYKKEWRVQNTIRCLRHFRYEQRASFCLGIGSEERQSITCMGTEYNGGRTP